MRCAKRPKKPRIFDQKTLTISRMQRDPTTGVEGAKPRLPRLKSAKGEIPKLSREYLAARNRQMRAKALTAEMEGAARRAIAGYIAGGDGSAVYIQRQRLRPGIIYPGDVVSGSRADGCCVLGIVIVAESRRIKIDHPARSSAPVPVWKARCAAQ